MDEINKKANKIRQQKIKAKTKKPIEDFVMDFFKETEDLMRFSDHATNQTLLRDAKEQLEIQIKHIYDEDAFITVQQDEAGTAVGSVIVHWSKAYQINYKTSETTYIGIESILFG